MAPRRDPEGSASAAPGQAAADAYWELEAELHPASEELWGVFCYERGALGAEVLEDSGPIRRLRHFFDHAPAVGDWQAEFAAAFARVPPPLRLTLRRQAVQAWETAWRAHFTPLRLGRRLLIVPPWEPAGGAPAEPGDAERVRIVIDPGQGFGTGWHPSTAAALLALEAHLAAGLRPGRLLDVGTGSGILAIAGCLLGAGAAYALDVDAHALPEVRRNFALSLLPPPRGLVQARPDALRGSFPLVLANIVAEVLRAHRDDLAALTAPGGCLILSGILAHERDGLLAAYGAAGLRSAREQRQGDWVALTLRRA